MGGSTFFWWGPLNNLFLHVQEGGCTRLACYTVQFQGTVAILTACMPCSYLAGVLTVLEGSLMQLPVYCDYPSCVHHRIALYCQCFHLILTFILAGSNCNNNISHQLYFIRNYRSGWTITAIICPFKVTDYGFVH